MKKQPLKKDPTVRKPKDGTAASSGGLATLVELPPPSGNGGGNGDGHNGNGHEELKAATKKALVVRNQFESAFSTPRQTSATDHLVLPGDNVHDLAMRGDFPSKYGDGNVKVRAAMRHLAKCIHFHDEEGAIELLNVMAGDVAVGGKRIEMLVQAIIGEREYQKTSRGFQEKVQNLAFGHKEDAASGK